MMEDRYHATTQNRFYPDMSKVNKNITVKGKLISQPTYKADETNQYDAQQTMDTEHHWEYLAFAT